MLTSTERRYALLRDFFRNHGLIACIPQNYLHYANMMASLVDGHLEGPLASPEDCMSRSGTYEYAIIKNEAVLCTIPAITNEGCFIINGQEKALMIQEVRLQTELCISVFDDKGLTVCCDLLVDGAGVLTRVKMSVSHIIELDTSSIHRDMRNIKSIGIYDVIDVFSQGEDDVFLKVSYMLRSYCAEHHDVCMVYIRSSTKGLGGLLPELDKETIRSKMFGPMSDRLVVATIVTMAASCVMAKFGYLQPSDRDNYTMKQLKMPGETVYKLFTHCLRSCKNNIKNLSGMVDRHMQNLVKRGEMKIGGKTYDKLSVQMSRRSHIDSLSCVRKILIPCDDNSPNQKMRQIHESQMGYVCPCETPEGKAVGITKSLASCCVVSTKTDISGWVSKSCKKNILEKFERRVWAIVDGAVAGWFEMEKINEIKKTYTMVSVSLSTPNVAKIRTCSGRPLRPLLIVKNGPIDWRRTGCFNDMLSSGNIEYLDPAESAKSIIASTGYDGDWSAFTHMEIHPCTMLGLAASTVPFPEHNQSARNLFASAMVKQAMQMYGSEKTCDYLQRPLVYTETSRIMGCDDNPNGVNLVTCIMSINGYNQEDAIIVKKSAVERGLFSFVARRSTSETVDSPWNKLGSVSADGSLFLLHGSKEKSTVEIRSMMSSPKFAYTRESTESNGRIKLDINMSEHRSLQLGDKLASRHAQKGVVGQLMNEVDMPFTSNGTVPDIIINPHAIPSRMTVGQLLEGVLGKSAAMNATFEDGTPFIRRNMKDLKTVLQMSDEEHVILGTTGDAVRTPVAIGIVYYMALKHQAADKMYVRSSGLKSIMSRQPISGRSKGGGLRFGEMEYECLIAHGASKMITKVSENSDMIDAPYCKICEIVTDIFDEECRICKNTTVRKRMPFSYVVCKDLMLSANICIHTKM